MGEGVHPTTLKKKTDAVNSGFTLPSFFLASRCFLGESTTSSASIKTFELHDASACVDGVGDRGKRREHPSFELHGAMAPRSSCTTRPLASTLRPARARPHRRPSRHSSCTGRWRLVRVARCLRSRRSSCTVPPLASTLRPARARPHRRPSRRSSCTTPSFAFTLCRKHSRFLLVKLIL